MAMSGLQMHYFLTIAAVQPLFGQFVESFRKGMGDDIHNFNICSIEMLITGRAVQRIAISGFNMIVDVIVADLVPLRERSNYIAIVLMVDVTKRLKGIHYASNIMIIDSTSVVLYASTTSSAAEWIIFQMIAALIPGDGAQHLAPYIPSTAGRERSSVSRNRRIASLIRISGNFCRTLIHSELPGASERRRHRCFLGCVEICFGRKRKRRVGEEKSNDRQSDDRIGHDLLVNSVRDSVVSPGAKMESAAMAPHARQACLERRLLFFFGGFCRPSARAVGAGTVGRNPTETPSQPANSRGCPGAQTPRNSVLVTAKPSSSSRRPAGPPQHSNWFFRRR
ncbi:integral membrane transport protein [Coccidioides immitis RMSCC 2394]|uniref:Integral membrane transport protein n=1 Tax=Coccidioides immitis RMSCC 2394 TaxID=404692 RepID=A0A0J6YQT2_COCIT|nr:integral membrane transport protein [Coccidioides immitis RMSCC 2394]